MYTRKLVLSVCGLLLAVEEQAQAVPPGLNDPLLERFFGLEGIPELEPQPPCAPSKSSRACCSK